MEKLFTRAELYEMVWARPATKVAAELGISGVALGKICRRHEVPVPARGHWAKLAAGKPVRTVRLPTVTDRRLEEIRILGSALERLPTPVLVAREKAVALEARAAASDKPEHSSPIKVSLFRQARGQTARRQATEGRFHSPVRSKANSGYGISGLPGSSTRRAGENHHNDARPWIRPEADRCRPCPCDHGRTCSPVAFRNHGRSCRTSPPRPRWRASNAGRPATSARLPGENGPPSGTSRKFRSMTSSPAGC